MTRTVYCVKLHKELPGLDKPPFSGELGQRIYDHISAEAFAEWKPQLTILINHYGLNPADPDARKMLRKQMEAFFFSHDNESLSAQEHDPGDVRTT